MAQSFDEFGSHFRSLIDPYCCLGSFVVLWQSFVYNILQLSICSHSDDRVSTARQIREDPVLNSFPCPADAPAAGKMWLEQPLVQKSWIMQRMPWLWLYIGFKYFPFKVLPSALMMLLPFGPYVCGRSWNKGQRTALLIVLRLGDILKVSSKHVDWNTDGEAIQFNIFKFVLFHGTYRTIFHGVPFRFGAPLVLVECALCVLQAFKMPHDIPFDEMSELMFQAAFRAVLMALGFCTLEYIILMRLYQGSNGNALHFWSSRVRSISDTIASVVVGCTSFYILFTLWSVLIWLAALMLSDGNLSILIAIL